MMINKSIISKSIDVAIWKCSQRLTLNKKIVSTFNSFAKSTRGRETEKAVLVDDKGNILKSKNGTATGVNIIKDGIKAYGENNNKPLHIDHNHPNHFEDPAPTSLSIEDMERLLDVHPDTNEFIFKSVTAEDSFNHSRMTLVRGDNFSSTKDKKNFDKAKEFLWNNVGIDSLLLHFSTTERNFKNLWDNIKNKPKTGTKEYEDLFSKTLIKASNMSLESGGFYKEFSKAQEMFRKANCRLSMDWIID